MTRTDPRTWWKDGVKPTDDDYRRAKIISEAHRMLGQYWETPPDDLMLDDVIEELAARLMWELAADENGVLSPDSAHTVYENVGVRLSALVD